MLNELKFVYQLLLVLTRTKLKNNNNNKINSLKLFRLNFLPISHVKQCTLEIFYLLRRFYWTFEEKVSRHTNRETC